MELMTVVTCLILVEYFYFSCMVARARLIYEIPPPKTIGHEEYERAYRVQQNTVEHLIVVLPSMWIFGMNFRPDVAAALGVIFIVGRFIYYRAYMTKPTKRALGFVIGLLPTFILLVGALISASIALF